MRRGAEREVHAIGTSLAQRGHNVRLITGQPTGFTRVTDVDQIRVRYVHLPVPAALRRRGWDETAVFGAAAAAAGVTSRADVALSFLYADAYGLTLANKVPLRRERGRPVVLKLTGTVLPDRIAKERVQNALLRRALEHVDAVWCNSAYARDVMSGFGVPMEIVPAGVDVEVFRPLGPRSEEPVVLCTAAPDEPRKRVVDLVDAWPAIVDGLPGARLVLAGHASAPTRAALLDRLPNALHSSVDIVGVLSDLDMVRAYSEAHVVVAPSVYEALGLSVLEALACGTPVAGARSGATVELVEEGRSGALFEPADPTSLASAVLRGAALVDAVEDCRAVASRYAWPVIVDDVERRLLSLTDGAVPRRAGTR